jgi:hypothetical protein
MKGKSYLKYNIVILLAVALSLCLITNISATGDIVGEFNETLLTIESPSNGSTYISPEVTFVLQKYIDYTNVNLSNNYTNMVKTCTADNAMMVYSNTLNTSSSSLGEYTLTKNLTNGQKTISFVCYNSTMSDLANVIYTKNIIITIDYTSIKTCSDLNRINLDLTSNYNLANNIDCLGGGFRIGTYYGIFDGKGYSINNYASNGALVSKLYGKIQNLKLQNISIDGGQYSSGLVGSAYAGSIIDNIKVQGTLKVQTGGTADIGGIVGRGFSGSIIKNSESNISIDARYSTLVGGIAGETEGIIENCNSYGMVYGGGKTGGIVGDNLGLVNKTISYGEMKGTISTIGGAIGRNYGKIKDVYYDMGISNISSCIGTDLANTIEIRDKECKTLGQKGANSLNITVDGKNINELNITESQIYLNFIIYDGWKPVMMFNYSIIGGDLSFNDTIITDGLTDKLSGYMIIRGLDASKLYGGTKTIYLNRQNSTMTDVCIKDADIESKDDISTKCDQLNEYIVKCDGVITEDGYTCTLNEETNQYAISGLKHSGVIQTDAVETTTTTTTTTTSSGGSGGSSGCYMNYTCSEWGACYDGNRIRTCTNSKTYCTLGTKPTTMESCESPENYGINPNLISQHDIDKQNGIDHESGKAVVLLVMFGGAIILIFVYVIFHWIEHYEMRKFRLKQRPIVSKKRK